MLNDTSSAHPLPKYSRQYSLEPVHGATSYPASLSGYTGSSLYATDTSPGPIISDVTELPQSSPSVSPNPSLEGRCSPVILIKDEPLTPDSPAASEQSLTPPEPEDNFPSPSTFIDSILQDSEPSDAPLSAQARTPPNAPEPCLSVACLDNISSSRQMAEISRLFSSSSSSLQGRTELGLDMSVYVFGACRHLSICPMTPLYVAETICSTLTAVIGPR
ncbi:heat shock factor 1 isoform X1 [Pelobates cultripes]|nr:heat shock factor 1 isoform X1 [Pelobates cultripes]